MPRGRPPKSIEAKRLDGTLRVKQGDRRCPQIPLVIGGKSAPEPSEFLSALERECFDEVVSVLQGGNLLDCADAGMVEIAAIERANVIECNRILGAEGLVMTGVMGGAIAHPACSMRSKSLVHLRQLYGELGIGPASRARLQNMGVTNGAEPAKVIEGLAGVPELRVVGDA